MWTGNDRLKQKVDIKVDRNKKGTARSKQKLTNKVDGCRGG